ncbi:MAG: VCBS repeat-containing protein, partial [Cyclobacteriaceae bacterium]|nr:VCBS repeat-containing protein [Cyclobacteriaceae bacterium HetDA_MAG_MS6]
MKKILTAIFVLGIISLGAQVIVDEDFNTTDGNWEASSSPTGTFWEWGTPAGATISVDNGGGGKAWVTELDGEFTLTDFTEIYLASQAYDLTSLSAGYISFAINYDLYINEEFGEFDAMSLQYSTDSSSWNELGSNETGLNWFNYFGGWQGNSGGWLQAAHELPAGILGESTVYFRFGMSTNLGSGAYGTEGFAFDDLVISSASIQSEITDMTLAESVYPASIDSAARVITLFVPEGTSVSNLAPEFTLSDGAISDKTSGSTQDFSNPVTYTVTAENTAFTSTWTVQVKNPIIDISILPDDAIPGSTVTIYGKGFSSIASENTVTFGSNAATILSASEGSLSVTVPSMDAGNTQVTVITNGSQTRTKTNFSVLATDVESTLIEEDDFEISGPSVIYTMGLGDFDLDEDFDLVYDNGVNLGVAEIENGLIVSTTAINTSRTTSPSQVHDLIIGDINNDTLPDIISGGTQIGWFENNGDGTWSTENAIDSLSGSNGLRVFDADCDFDLDILANTGSSVVLLKNDGAGNFSQAAGTLTNLGIPVDWDGDGDTDMIYTGFDGDTFAEGIIMLENDGSGRFSDSTLFETSATDLDLAQVGDMDNDGDLDVIFTTNDGFTSSSIRYLQNNGGGSFTEVSIATDNGDFFDTRSLELGDINGDGFLDIARTMVGDFNGDQIFGIYLTSAALTFGSLQELDGNINGFDIELLDIDEDGDLDILQEASLSGPTGGVLPLFRNAIGEKDIVGFS